MSHVLLDLAPPAAEAPLDRSRWSSLADRLEWVLRPMVESSSRMAATASHS
jgi:hypothetical protein